jgi:Hypervirulence associated proteins TUDOR domain
VIMLRLGQIGNEEGRPTCRANLVMAKRFRRGDRVSWNSEAGRVRGRIVKVHTKNVNYKGYVHHASKENPQYEIKSDKTDHVALHKASALRRIRR